MVIILVIYMMGEAVFVIRAVISVCVCVCMTVQLHPRSLGVYHYFCKVKAHFLRESCLGSVVLTKKNPLLKAETNNLLSGPRIKL